MNGIRQRFEYGGESFAYQVYVDPTRRRKSVKIDVHPNGAIAVTAPDGYESDQIKSAVLKRARWITSHVKDARVRLEDVTRREYVSGETHYYLGRAHVLRVTDACGAAESAKLLRGRLVVAANGAAPERVRNLLTSWYRRRAEDVFSKRTREIWPRLVWVNEPPRIVLRAMQRQWGSCSPSGNVLLNPALVKAPVACIDYVIVHELCHIREHNHSPAFFSLLDRLMPDWRAVKARLDGMGEVLLNS